MGNQRALKGFAVAGTLPAIVGLGVTQIIGWGTTYTPITIFGAEIGREIGLSREVVFGGLAVMLIISAFTAPRIGQLCDRRGPRDVMLAGSILCAGGMVLMAMAQGFASYILAWFVTGLGTPVVFSTVAHVGLAQIAGRDARRAITGLMLFTGLSSFFFLPISQALGEWIGWRGAYLVFAALHVLVCLPLHWLVLRKHREPLELKSAGEGSLQDGLLPGDVRSYAFLMLAVWCCMDGFISWGLAVNIIDVLQQYGLSREVAVWAWAIVGPVQSLTRICELIWGGRYPVLLLAVVAGGLLPVAFMMFLPGVTTATTFAFALVYGVSHGAYAIARATIPLALFGQRGYGALMGRLALPQNLINAAAPIVFASAYTNLGSGAALLLGALAAAVSGAGALALVAIGWRHNPPREP
ncbi:MAG: MFS transporter [Hyphomicrobiaceae bacterium]|nr:MAG: MFS transporter [Hyphomicrobiaceae bacterium]